MIEGIALMVAAMVVLIFVITSAGERPKRFRQCNCDDCSSKRRKAEEAIPFVTQCHGCSSRVKAGLSECPYCLAPKTLQPRRLDRTDSPHS